VTPFKDLPMSRKLMRMSVAISVLVLLMSCAAFTFYEAFAFRKTAVEQLSVEATMIGINSTPAILFSDRAAAAETLASLRASPNVISAAIYLADGSPFATYLRSAGGSKAALPSRLDDTRDTSRIEAGRLMVRRTIESDAKPLAVIYIQSDLSAIVSRLQGYALIAAGTSVLSFIAALLLSRGIERRISAPILGLATAAESLAGGDLSARCGAPYSRDEIGTVARSFDGMAVALSAQIASQHEKEEALRLNLDRTERAEARVRQQLQLMHTLDEITRSISERLDLQSIFQVVVSALEHSLPADFCCIALNGPQEDVFSVERFGVNSMALAKEILRLTGQEAFGIERQGFDRCLRGELVYEPDVSGLSFAFSGKLNSRGLRSMVVAPLRSESAVFGLLIAARREVDGFTSSECELLRQLSEHVALAAGQAQLHGALQQAYDDLRQTQQVVMQEERLRALGQMASGIAHDINNALSPVSLYTESLLETEKDLSARGRSYLETILRAVEDVAETVARMREFYRQREDQVALRPFDANELMRQVLDLTRARWRDMPQQKGIAIRASLEPARGLPRVMGIESEIREALTNLVFNAVDAMPEGGSIVLRTRVVDASPRMGQGAVAIEVIDSGVGMDEDTRKRCLEPFFTTKGERGTGLGLAMVFGAVQRHGAEIEIDSAVGKGTCVRLLFPVPGEDVAAGPPTTGIHRIPSWLRLLLVDDDPVLLASLQGALESDGHAIIAASGGNEGIAMFRSAVQGGTVVSAVITDLGMPHVDGRKVAAAIKEISPTTPVIMLTGWGQRLIADGEVPPHVDRVLAKPPKLRELREALASLCFDQPNRSD